MARPSVRLSLLGTTELTHSPSASLSLSSDSDSDPHSETDREIAPDTSAQDTGERDTSVEEWREREAESTGEGGRERDKERLEWPVQVRRSGPLCAALAILLSLAATLTTLSALQQRDGSRELSGGPTTVASWHHGWPDWPNACALTLDGVPPSEAPSWYLATLQAAYSAQSAPPPPVDVQWLGDEGSERDGDSLGLGAHSLHPLATWLCVGVRAPTLLSLGHPLEAIIALVPRVVIDDTNEAELAPDEQQQHEQEHEAGTTDRASEVEVEVASEVSLSLSAWSSWDRCGDKPRPLAEQLVHFDRALDGLLSLALDLGLNLTQVVTPALLLATHGQPTLAPPTSQALTTLGSDLDHLHHFWSAPAPNSTLVGAQPALADAIALAASRATASLPSLLHDTLPVVYYHGTRLIANDPQVLLTLSLLEGLALSSVGDGAAAAVRQMAAVARVRLLANTTADDAADKALASLLRRTLSLNTTMASQPPEATPPPPVDGSLTVATGIIVDANRSAAALSVIGGPLARYNVTTGFLAATADDDGVLLPPPARLLVASTDWCVRAAVGATRLDAAVQVVSRLLDLAFEASDAINAGRWGFHPTPVGGNGTVELAVEPTFADQQALRRDFDLYLRETPTLLPDTLVAGSFTDRVLLAADATREPA